MLRRLARPSAALGAGAAASFSAAHCSGEDHIPSLDYGWNHHGALASFDYSSIRRGFQVYKQVCASCHSIDKIAFRNLVGVTHDEAGAKKIAESYEITDGPNDQGEMFERPGKLSDKIPGPYKNEGMFGLKSLGVSEGVLLAIYSSWLPWCFFCLLTRST